MTTAIWFLYFADVAGSLGFLSGLVAFVFIFGIAIYAFSFWIDDGAFRFPKTALYIGLAAAVLSAVIPSKETLYAAAAVHVGSAAIDTETGGKAIAALNAWLDRQIAGEDDAKKGDE